MRFGTPSAAIASGEDPAPSMSQCVDMLRLGKIGACRASRNHGPGSPQLISFSSKPHKLAQRSPFPFACSPCRWTECNLRRSSDRPSELSCQQRREHPRNGQLSERRAPGTKRSIAIWSECSISASREGSDLEMQYLGNCRMALEVCKPVQAPIATFCKGLLTSRPADLDIAPASAANATVNELVAEVRANDSCETKQA